MIFRWVLWFLVLTGLGAAGYNGARRWKVEQDNRTVEIVLDYGELRSLSAQTGQGFVDVCRVFKEVGATSVAVTEETLGSMEETKRIELIPTSQLGESYFFVHQGNFRRVLNAIQTKTRYSVKTPPDLNPDASEDAGMRANQPFNIIRGLGVGLDPRAVSAVREVGLGVVGRVANYPSMRSEGIRHSLEQLKNQGVNTIIFVGDEVIGHKHLVADDPKNPKLKGSASLFAEVGLTYGTVEFGKQKGDAELTRLAAGNTARVHTVLGSEMVSATIPGNVQRFLLAARERNIRVLYVRLFPDERDPLDTNARYVRSVAEGLKERGFEVGPARGFEPLTNPLPIRAVIGLGLAAGILLLLDALTGLLAGGGVGLTLAAITVSGAVGALPAMNSFMGVKIAALASACVFPALGLLMVDHLQPVKRNEEKAAVALRFGLMSVITLIGATYVVGLLCDRLFLIKSDAFLGIKFSQLIPLGIAALGYGLKLRAATFKDFKLRVNEAIGTIKRILAQPIYVWQASAGVFALILLVLLVARSGNDPGVGVSESELKIRSLLDHYLYARPRFKEFLLGHPLMIVALVLGVRGWRGWAIPVFLVGAIGQVSLLNTFCHLHTPLLVSLWRAGLGLLIGVALGVLITFFLPRPKNADA